MHRLACIVFALCLPPTQPGAFANQQVIGLLKAGVWTSAGGPGTSTREGHSVGHWEGDVLVVDTTNFADHRSPYQNGVPSGPRKHVVERYTLLEGGTRMAVDFMLEDPEYLAEPMRHARELIHVPQLAMTPFDCDPDATNMFRMELEP